MLLPNDSNGSGRLVEFEVDDGGFFRLATNDVETGVWTDVGAALGIGGTADTVTEAGTLPIDPAFFPFNMDWVSTTTKPELLELFSFDRGTTVTLVAEEMEIFDKIGAFISSGGGLVTLLIVLTGDCLGGVFRTVAVTVGDFLMSTVDEFLPRGISKGSLVANGSFGSSSLLTSASAYFLGAARGLKDILL